MKRVVTYTLITIALLLATGVYISLSIKQGQIDKQVTDLEFELKMGAEKYTRCHYSINNGSYVVNDVSLSHFRYDSTDAEKVQLNKIGSDFMNDVKRWCDNVVASYEGKYAEDEQKSKEAASVARIPFLIEGNQTQDGKMDELSVIRFKTGDALTFFVFTKEDVEKYFNQRLEIR